MHLSLNLCLIEFSFLDVLAVQCVTESSIMLIQLSSPQIPAKSGNGSYIVGVISPELASLHETMHMLLMTRGEITKEHKNLNFCIYLLSVCI